MKTCLLLIAILTSTAAADVSIFDNDQTITVDCAKDKTVNITGNKAKVTLTGTCEVVRVAGNKASVSGSVAEVMVSGNENKLALDQADVIAVTGNRNTVSYKKGIKAASVKVSISGKDNKVTPLK